MVCPVCGNPKFKEVSENVQQKYRQCENCRYSPALERAEPVDAKAWVEEIAAEYAAAVQSFQEANAAYEEKQGTLTMGKKNKATRELAIAKKKVTLAEAVSTIVGETESGQITLLIPEIGLFQFEYGDFDLFKVIGSDGTNTRTS